MIKGFHVIGFEGSVFDNNIVIIVVE